MLSILSLNNALFCVTRKYKRIAVEGRIRRLSASVEGPIHGKATFDLTPDEKKLFENLKLFVTETKLPISIRVAGGWVRDKLLSLQGKNDIDITLDSLSGIQFLDRYNRWRLRRGEGKRSYYIVKKNPSKSKHLETVACKLENLDIDFVNLRTEAYTENSRIPEIEVGTPKEDALRRDLTINSLFYNIQSGNIEDFTGQGIKDLENKIVRTPLPAIITLTDDPLRALRAIRFACRLNFNIDSELLRACQERSVHDSLRLKVSSNRVSDEIFGMLQTLAFHRSIFLMYKTRLLQTILPVPPEISMYFSYGNGNDRQEMIHDIFVFSVLLQRYISTIPTNPSVKNSSCSIQNIALKVETDKDLLSSSVFVNMVMASNIKLTKSRNADSQKTMEFFQAAREQLVLPNKLLKEYSYIHTCIPRFKQLLSVLLHHSSEKELNNEFLLFEDETDPFRLSKSKRCLTVDKKTGQISRLTLGLAVHMAGPRYKEVLLLAAISTVIDELAVNQENQRSTLLTHDEVDRLINSLAKSLQLQDCENFPSKYSIDDTFNHLEKTTLTVIRHAGYILHMINYWKLNFIFDTPPLLRGDEILKLNPKCKTEQIMVRTMLNIQLRWQIINPKGSVEELKKFLCDICQIP